MKSLISFKHIILFAMLLISVAATSQDKPLIALRTFVKQDTILLRWAPTSPDLFIKGLKKGYTIERVEGATFENNPSKVTFLIPPFSETKASFANSTDANTQAMTGFTNELATSGSLAESTKKIAFSILMLSAATSKELAKMTSLYFEDVLPSSASGNDYSYRVSITNSNETSNVATMNSLTLSQHKIFTVLTGEARPKLRQAYLSWEAKSLQDAYSAYWIERSTDSIHFEKRNTVPYLFLRSQDEPNKVNCDFVDSNVVEGMTYYYRITGISHFAETGKSSNIVMVYVPKSLYGECRIDTVVAEGLSRKISGEFVPVDPVPSRTSGTESPMNTLVKFVLLRSDSVLHSYHFVSEKNADGNSFYFEAPVPVESGDRYYYKVAALSEDNDTVYSFPYYFFTLDQMPPSMPQNLAGVVNDSGIVSLTWTTNPENDIRGYRIFRSNDLKEEFTEVTTDFCVTNTFHDTLQLDNLTSNVYYRMTAVDLNFNNSETTAPVLLLKPDTIPPVQAVFRDYEVLKNGVSLTWINSTSIDLASSILIRNSTDTLARWQDTTQHFFDSTGVEGESYTYSIVAADRSENCAVSTDLFVNYETGTRPGISGLQAVVDRTEKHIALSWVLPKGELYSIQIYRAKNDEAFRLVKTIRDGAVISFTDKDLSINNTYKYKVKLVYKSGVSSEMSAGVVVVY